MATIYFPIYCPTPTGVCMSLASVVPHYKYCYIIHNANITLNIILCNYCILRSYVAASHCF